MPTGSSEIRSEERNNKPIAPSRALAVLVIGWTACALCMAQEPAPTQHVFRLPFAPKGMNLGLDLPLDGTEAVFQKEPDFQGHSVVRNILPVGSDRSTWLGFAWDESTGNVYFDLNRNGDLTDDPPGFALRNAARGPVSVLFVCPLGPAAVPYAADFGFYRDPGTNKIACWCYVGSGWQGKIALGGREWLAAVVDNPGPALDGDDCLILKPDTGEDAEWNDPNDPGRLPLPKRLFLDGRLYEVNYAFEKGEKGLELVLTFAETAPDLGELSIDGQYVRHLVLQGGKKEDLTVAVFENPPARIQVPAGEYSHQRVMVHDDPKRGVYIATANRMVQVAPSQATSIALGGPLKPCVRAAPDRMDLALDFELRGRGGEEYKVWFSALGEDYFKAQRAAPKLRPQFVVRQGAKEIASGSFEYG